MVCKYSDLFPHRISLPTVTRSRHVVDVGIQPMIVLCLLLRSGHPAARSRTISPSHQGHAALVQGSLSLPGGVEAKLLQHSPAAPSTRMTHTCRDVWRSLGNWL